MSTPTPGEASGDLVVLGAGYAGLTFAQEVHRRSRGRIPITLVDQSPAHELRTELYEVGRIAESQGDPRPWSRQLTRVLERSSVKVRTSTVRGIDLPGRRIQLDDGPIGFRELAICLGSVAAYYGVPGAAENCVQVYRLSEAQRCASEILRSVRASAELPGERRPRVVVVGGGSTGTELAAEIASTDWSRLAGPGSRNPDVVLLVGALPLLAGLPPPLVAHARDALRSLGVFLVRGLNVVRVDPGRVFLEDGSAFACDLAVWCAGLEAPPLVRGLPASHGRGGRLAVEPTLELSGHPGVFGVGDVVEFSDPSTGLLVPATAQAALAEARTAAINAVARWDGSPLSPFQYHERGVVVSLGLGRAAAQLRRLSLWGSPAALLKTVVQKEYARSVGRGRRPRLL